MLLRLIRFYRQRTASIAVLALLLAQAIGLAHGIAHPHSRGGLPSATVAATVATERRPPGPTACTTKARCSAVCSTSSRMPTR